MGSEDCGGGDGEGNRDLTEAHYQRALNLGREEVEKMEVEKAAFLKKAPEGFDERFLEMFATTKEGVGYVKGLYHIAKEVLDEMCKAEPDNEAATKACLQIEEALKAYNKGLVYVEGWKERNCINFGFVHPKYRNGASPPEGPSLSLQELKYICFPLAYRKVDKGLRKKVLLKCSAVSAALKGILTDLFEEE